MTQLLSFGSSVLPAVELDPFVLLLREPSRLVLQDLASWDRTLRLARASNLLGRIAVEITERNELDRVPVEASRHLVAARTLVEHQQASMKLECSRIEKALGTVQAPVVLLKGAAYASSSRRASRGRLFGDVDILVPRAALSAAEAALMLHGWSLGQIDPYDERYYRQWMHELPPMAHLQRGTVVDVHHNILPRTSKAAPDPDLLLADCLPVAGTRLRILGPADMVIHSAVHLFHESELRNGLRDLLDLDALLREFSESDPDFWQTLCRRTATHGLSWPVHLAVRYACAMLATPIPESASAELSRQADWSPWFQRLIDEVYLRALQPEHPLVSSRGSRLARAVVYLRGHALRMPLPRLALHLGRKAALRTVKHTSRLNP